MAKKIDIHSNFTGLQDYRKFMRKQKLNRNNKDVWDDEVKDMPLGVRRGWFGKDVTVEEMQKPITKFSNPKLIDEVYEKVKSKIPKEFKSKLKEHKMRFTDRETGVFSMDRFMMGMYHRPAFFNMKSNSYVPPNMVYEKDKKYFYRLDNSPCRIDKKLATNNKKVYAYFPQIDSNKKVVEILIIAGANSNTTAKQMLYTGITGIVLAEMCENANIKVQISVAIGSHDASNSYVNFAIVPVKAFNSAIDRNVIALLTSDARVFRYEMFKGIISNYNESNKNVPYSLGSLITKQKIEEIFKDEKLKKKHFKSEKVFFTSGIFSEEKCIETIEMFLNEMTDNKKTNDNETNKTTVRKSA